MGDATPDAFDDVLGAYLRFGDGDATKLIALLGPDVQWCADDAVCEIGRERAASRFLAATGTRVDLIGARRSADSLVLEFTRPWWSDSGAARTMLRSLFGVHGEQALRFDHGLVSRIESRALPARTAG